MRAAAVLGQGDLILGPAAEDARGDVVEIGVHIGLFDHAARDRVLQLADVVDGGGAAVDEDARPAHHLVIHLAHVGAIGADQVQMRAGPQPFPLHQRRQGHRRGADDIGMAHGVAQIFGRGDVFMRAFQGQRGLEAAVPDGEMRARKGAAIGLDHRPRHRSCAQDHDLAAVGARQQPGRQQAVAGGLPLGHQMEIHQRRQGARPVVIKGDGPVHRRHAPRGIARKDRGTFDQRAQPVDPGRAVQQRVLVAIQKRVADRGARQEMARQQGIGQPLP